MAIADQLMAVSSRWAIRLERLRQRRVEPEYAAHCIEFCRARGVEELNLARQLQNLITSTRTDGKPPLNSGLRKAKNMRKLLLVVFLAIAIVPSAKSQGTIPVGAKPAPPPPKPGDEKEWARKWCGIGWREYGEEHIDKCMTIIPIHAETSSYLQGSSAEKRESVDNVRERIERYRQRQAEAEDRARRKKESEYWDAWERYGRTEIKKSSWKLTGATTWNAQARFETPDTSGAGQNLHTLLCIDYNLGPCGKHGMIAVDCKSLMVNTYENRPNPLYELLRSEGTKKKISQPPRYIYSWGAWTRPGMGADYERLIINRCSNR